MDQSELRESLPAVLEQVFPGRTSEIVPGSPVWLLTGQDNVSAIGALSGPDQVRITSGCARDVPETLELHRHLSALNKQFMIGRIYAINMTRPGLCDVVMEDIIFGAVLSWDFVPSMQDLATRATTLTNGAARAGVQIRAQFGGRPFTPDDVMALL